MGYGDEIMALGQAQEIIRQGRARRVGILDKDGRPRWHEVWEQHREIARPGEEADLEIVNGPNARPYIKRWSSWQGRPRAVFSKWRARDHRAELNLPRNVIAAGDTFRDMAGRYVVIEPNIKGTGSPNKLYGLHRFQAIVDRLPWVHFVQFDIGRPLLENVRAYKAPSFIEALGILNRASAYLGIEGGLHHAAAALKVPGIVIFGGFTPTETTGYPEHKNIYVEGPESPCGRYAPCPHCLRAMASIPPANVALDLVATLRRLGMPTWKKPIVDSGGEIG